MTVNCKQNCSNCNIPDVNECYYRDEVLELLTSGEQRSLFSEVRKLQKVYDCSSPGVFWDHCMVRAIDILNDPARQPA
jgi:hypothetical protein